MHVNYHLHLIPPSHLGFLEDNSKSLLFLPSHHLKKNNYNGHAIMTVRKYINDSLRLVQHIYLDICFAASFVNTLRPPIFLE